jgi:type I restriction enzyme S subunit
MVGEWREVTLGEIAELVRGVSYRPADLLPDSSNGIPLLRATNIRDGGLDLGDVLFVPPELVQPNQMLRRYDVVIAMSSGSREAVGRLAQLRQDWIGCVGAFCAVIRADPRGVHPDFLGFVLQSPDFRTHVETHAVGTAIMNLSRERILGFSLKLPPLPEQRAIAHILGTLDDKIELNRRMSETLEAMARALFKAWFVDFEPVRAKMEGRWQRGQSLPGLPAHLYDLFPDRLVDSELGEIPEGWEVKSLDEIAHFLNGLALQKYPPKEGRSLPVIKIAQLRSGNTLGADQASADLDPDYVVADGDILFSWSGSLECVVWAGGPGALNQHLFKVTPKRYPRWLCYFGVHAHLEEFRHIAAGKATTMGHIQRHHLSEAKLAVPPYPLLEVMDRCVSPIFEASWKRHLESRTLSALRDALLPKLIRGEIRVKDAERFLKEREL